MPQFNLKLIALCSLVCLAPARADVPSAAPSPPSSKSVYSVDPWIDGSIIATNAAFTLFAYSRPELFISKTCPCNPEDVGAVDRSAIYYDRPALYHLATAGVYASITVPLIYDYGDLGWSKEFKEDLVVFTEVLAVDQGLTTALKFTIQRPFPHRYNPDNHYPDEAGDFIAFPSGHTSTVAALMTASAMTRTLRYGASPGPWLLAGASTAAVAYAMVQSGEHFTTDVIAGAFLGAAVGVAIPWLHSRKGLLAGLSIAPISSGAALIYALRF